MMTLHRTLIGICTLLLSVCPSFAAGVEVQGGLTRAFTAEPGKKIEGTVVLQNTADTPQQVRAYQTDYLFFADGKNVYGDPGSAPRSNSAWMTVTPRQALVPAKGTATVHYTIQVPSDPKLTGTYWSMLMIEPMLEGSLEPPKENKPTLAVHTVMRYGIQFVTDIGGSGKRAIRFSGKELVNEGTHVLRLDIENTGERWLRPSVRAEAYDAKGAYLGRFEGGTVRIYPGCSQRADIKLPSLSAGTYTALAVVDNGDESVWGAQYELNIK